MRGSPGNGAQMATHRWYLLPFTLLVASCGGDPGSGPAPPPPPPPPPPPRPTQVSLSLKNVNVIPGLTVDLFKPSGERKPYRIQGGPEITEPIALALASADVEVTLQMDQTEEVRVRPKRGATEGTAKPCRRRDN